MTVGVGSGVCTAAVVRVEDWGAGSGDRFGADGTDPLIEGIVVQRVLVGLIVACHVE